MNTDYCILCTGKISQKLAALYFCVNCGAFRYAVNVQRENVVATVKQGSYFLLQVYGLV